MGCNATIESESYDFFEDIENYIEKVKELQHIDKSDYISSSCSSSIFEHASSRENDKIASIVCPEFIKIYKSLKTDEDKLRDHIQLNYHWRFLNYWVNSKIAENRRNESYCIKKFFNSIKAFFLNIFQNEIFLHIYIYDIKEDELRKMNILYNLYKNHSELKEIIDSKPVMDKELLISQYTQCRTDYIAASNLCKSGNNKNKFCEKLKDFESKYNNLYNEVENEIPEISDNLKELTEVGDTNVVSTALLGSMFGLIPLMGVLYKFTPLGQLFNSKKRKLIEELRNNDEEIRNITLIDQESEHISSQQGKYNIKYHSV